MSPSQPRLLSHGRPLSPMRHRLLLWLAAEIAAGRPDPGDGAIMAALGWASRSSVHAALVELEAGGWITRTLTPPIGPRPGRRTIALRRDPALAAIRTPRPPRRLRTEASREKNPAVRARVVRLYRDGVSLRGCADRCGFPAGGTAVIGRILRAEGVEPRTRTAQLRATRERPGGQDPALPWPTVDRRVLVPMRLFEDVARDGEAGVFRRHSGARPESLVGCAAACCVDAA